MNGKAYSDEIKTAIDEELKVKEIKQRMRRPGGYSITAEERELVGRVERRHTEARRARLLRAMTPEQRRLHENPLTNPWPEAKGRLAVNPCGLGGWF